MHATRIEDYEARHARAVVELWRASFEHGTGIVDPHPLDAQLSFFVDEVLPAYRVRIAFRGAELAGFLASTPESVGHLYVAVPYLGRGIGSRMLNVAKSESSGSLWLYTMACNANARAFYSRHGFVDEGHGFANMWNLEDVRFVWRRDGPARPT